MSSVLCDHLEGWDREGGRETQEGGDTGYMYAYGWFTLLYNRNQHSIVKQLYPNKDVLKKKKRNNISLALLCLFLEQNEMMRDSYTGISLCSSKQQTQPLTCTHENYKEGRKKTNTPHHMGVLSGQITYSLEQRSPSFLAPGTGFVEDSFSMDRGFGWGWFRDDSSALHLLCTLLLLLLHCNI